MPASSKHAAIYLGALCLMNLILAALPSHVALMPFISLASALVCSVLIVRIVRNAQRYDELLEQQ